MSKYVRKNHPSLKLGLGALIIIVLPVSLRSSYKVESQLLCSWGNWSPEGVSTLPLAVIGSSTWRELLTSVSGDGEVIVFCDDVIGESDLGHMENQGESQEQRHCLLNTIGLRWTCTKTGLLTCIYGVPDLSTCSLVIGQTANNTQFLLLQCPQYLNMQFPYPLSCCSFCFLLPPPFFSFPNSLPIKALLR